MRVNTGLCQHVCCLTHNSGAPRHLKLQIGACGGHEPRGGARWDGGAAAVQQAGAAGGHPAGRQGNAHLSVVVEARRGTAMGTRSCV